MIDIQVDKKTTRPENTIIEIVQGTYQVKRKSTKNQNDFILKLSIAINQ